MSDIFQQLSELTETVVKRNGFGHLSSTTNDKLDTGIDIADLHAGMAKKTKKGSHFSIQYIRMYCTYTYVQSSTYVRLGLFLGDIHQVLAKKKVSK